MKLFIGMWFANALMLVLAWWGGYFLLYQLEFEWMYNPVHSLIFTHSAIKLLLTGFIIHKYNEKTKNIAIIDKINRENERMGVAQEEHDRQMARREESWKMTKLEMDKT